MDFEVTCSGMAKGKPPDPCVVVIFGATGDLARTTLVPALYGLERRGLLPESFALIGFARRDWDDATYRKEMHEFVKQHAAFERGAWEKFAAKMSYVRGDFLASATAGFAALRQRISKIQTERGIPDHVLLHLATSPDYYGEIVEKCAAASLFDTESGWRRVVIEKPFGHDEASARSLDHQLLTVISEDQLYRVDHYLGKETVQNMLVFRFTNPGFEPIWNHNYIDHVQITAAEDEGIGTRAGYYDKTGVVRDMIQSHLLQLLCMTAMDSPVFYDGVCLRNETFKVLQAVRPVDPRKDCVLGQYGPGRVDGQEVPGYRQEEDVPGDSSTPTFAAVKLYLDNWRWSGVPFYLRSGKCLPRKLTEVSISFKPTPHLMFPIADRDRLQNNVLTFRLQPDEGIHHTFLAKQPGPEICLRPVTMRFQYDRAFGLEKLPSAYEWLLLDAMQGEPTLFPRSDWIYKAWSIVDPIIQHWEAEPARILPNYAAGSWGPSGAQQLMERDRRSWLVM